MQGGKVQKDQVTLVVYCHYLYGLESGLAKLYLCATEDKSGIGLCASLSCCDTSGLTNHEATPAGLVPWFVLLATHGTLRKFQRKEGRPSFSLSLLCWSHRCLHEAKRYKSGWRTEARTYILAIRCHSGKLYQRVSSLGLTLFHF